jgi:hypothetical protein
MSREERPLNRPPIRKAVYGPPRRRAPAPTRLGWALGAVLVLLVAGVGLAITRAQEVDEVPRYVPSARSGRAAVLELAEQHFAPEQVSWAIAVAKCESGWNLYAYSAGFDRRWGVFYEHVGMLQVDGVSWRAKARELFGGDFIDPAVNVAMASWIVTNLGPSHWPYCGR